MLSQLASVFSSQGVVLPDTEQVAFPVRPQEPSPRPSDFPARFEQAATRLELSARALKAAEEAGKARGGEERDGGVVRPGPGPETGAGAEPAEGSVRGPGGRSLTGEEQKQVEDLKRRDREVRAHEQAHLAASAGQARGGAKFEFQAGPDGRRYAVGGHVDIDMTPVAGNPRATLQKAMAVRSAATAPAEPSGADLSVAAAAAQMAAQASRELSRNASGQGAKDAGRQDGANAGSGAGVNVGAGAGMNIGQRRAYAQADPGTGRAINLIA